MQTNNYKLALKLLGLCTILDVNAEENLPIIQIEKAPAITEPIAATAIKTNNCISRDEEGRFLGWVDNQHCLVSYRATQTAQWLDSLFGQVEDNEDSIGRIRIVNDFVWLEGSGLSGKTRIRASVKLPNAKRRFRLVISDEDDALYPNNTANSPTNTNEKTSAAVRWLPNITSKVTYSIDIGAHSTDVFSRFRAQREWRISDDSIFRFKETLRYGVKTEVKSVSEAQVERLINEKTVLRLSSALQYWQNEPDPVGLRWSQDNSVLHRISANKSVAYGVTMEGVQQPSWQINSDRLFVLYRQSFWRSWLYYEVEPQLVRDWTTGKDVKSVLVFRIEANFGN